MTDAEKANLVIAWLSPETVTSSEIGPYISMAQYIVLNKRFPFGYSSTTTVPDNLEYVQCRIALELWNKRGAEGEISHSENGINRTWSSEISPQLMKLITPCCESVVTS